MIKIRVPATSANLGSAFDTMGLALDRYNVFSFLEEGQSTAGESLVDVAYKKTFEYLKEEVKPVKIDIESSIPQSRGLGSSASCIIAGIMGANEILGKPIGKEEILDLATEIEGHPDNVAPALYGGLTISLVSEGKVYSSNLPIKNDYRFIVFVPDFSLHTEEARRILPRTVSQKDAVFNVSRASMLTLALVKGQDELIKIGLEDRLHQPYRKELIEGFDHIMEKIYELEFLGAYLSGAGPSIMAICKADDKEKLKKVRKFMKGNYPSWKVFDQKLDKEGAVRI